MMELRGKAVADALKHTMKIFLEQVDEINRPKLAIVRVGERSDDLAYERMVLKNCSAIHCCFMRFPIDVLYLDNEMRVVGKETVTPWHLGSVFPGAKHVLELNAGTTEEITLWQPLEWKERITP